jgi:hypothetical protein
MPSAASCQKDLPDSIAKRFWKVTHCEEPKHIINEEIIQVKLSDKLNYIYCNTLNISIYNRTLNCPDYVFSVPNSASFNINSISYESSLVNVQNTLSLKPDWGQRINFHLMPTLHNLNLTEIAKQTKEEINKIEHHTGPRFIEINSQPNMQFIYIILIIILLIALTVYFKRRRSKAIHSANVRNIEIQRHHQSQITHETEPLTTEEEENSNDDIYTPPMRSAAPLRRSERVLYLATIIGLIVAPTDAIDYKYIMIFIKFQSPCNELLLNNNTTPSQMAWCQNQFDLSFKKPVNTFCKIDHEILTINKHLYQEALNRRKRAYNSSNLNVEPNNYMITTIISSFAVLKEIINTIGRKWTQHKLDSRLFENSHFQIKLPSNMSLEMFEPHLCIADFQCDTITLMLHKTINTMWVEKYIIEFGLLIALIIALLIFNGVLKLINLRRKANQSYKVLYDKQFCEASEEINLPLPPFPAFA